MLIHKDFTLEGCARGYLIVALIFLLIGAILAIVAGLPWRYGYPTSDFMKKMIDKPHWSDSEVAARNMTAYSNLVVIDSLRPGTRIKAWVLVGAYSCQVAGIAALAGCTLAVMGICVWPMSHFARDFTPSASTTSPSPTPPSSSPSTVVVTVTCPCQNIGPPEPKQNP